MTLKKVYAHTIPAWADPEVRQNYTDGVFNKYISSFYKKIRSSLCICRTSRSAQFLATVILTLHGNHVHVFTMNLDDPLRLSFIIYPIDPSILATLIQGNTPFKTSFKANTSIVCNVFSSNEILIENSAILLTISTDIRVFPS